MQKQIPELLEFCIINVDKPAGLTSYKVCEKIRNITGAKKAGHFGTLDPMVTGVLPVALNRACRLSNYFMIKNKEYVGKMKIHSDISEEELKKEMEKFIGKIMQKPPVKSRVKRVFRERNIDKFKIIKKNGNIVEFESDVQAGTYIRKLISDLGERIGGAHMIELRRIRAGIFKENESHKIEEIQEAFKEYKNGNDKMLKEILIPAEIVKQVITAVQVKEEAVKELLNGKPLMKKDIAGSKPSGSENSKIAVFNKNQFIGIYKIVSSSENTGSEFDNSEEKENSIFARTEFVLN